MTRHAVVLRNTHDRLGTRFLGAELTPDGSLRISGQDIGAGVEQFFGYDEYEWEWTIYPDGVGKLADALGTDDILGGLRKRFADDAAAGLEAFLAEHGVQWESWSRIG